uniref:Uncharacterized protein n=1 Tax=Trichuris muris TaxID=70415 RepID=A0A5S6Q4G3_TRIMR
MVSSIDIDISRTSRAHGAQDDMPNETKKIEPDLTDFPERCLHTDRAKHLDNVPPPGMHIRYRRNTVCSERKREPRQKRDHFYFSNEAVILIQGV